VRAGMGTARKLRLVRKYGKLLAGEFLVHLSNLSLAHILPPCAGNESDPAPRSPT